MFQAGIPDLLVFTNRKHKHKLIEFLDESKSRMELRLDNMRMH